MRLPFDLETIPDQRPGAYDAIRAEVKAPAQYKKPESIDNWLLENGDDKADEVYSKTGLSGLTGEICAIGFAFGLHGEPISLVRNHDMTERDLLIGFADEIKTQRLIGEGDFQRLEWFGHNLIEFDLRFLKQRCLVNGVHLGVMIPADARHGNGAVFDIMKEWSGWKGYVKQDDLCKVFGLPTKPGMDGADVWPAWRDGRFHAIASYNRHDVRTVQAIAKLMLGIES